MLKVAFPYISRDAWRGGYNYLHNLFSALESLDDYEIHPLLFVGEDVAHDAILPFEQINGVEVVIHPFFNRGWKTRLLLRSMIYGRHSKFEELFLHHNTDLIFENACFFGRHCKIPTIAWIPDFQHRKLPMMFTFLARLKRELGFRSQIAAGRNMLLSSNDAKRDFESFYPKAQLKLFVVPFAVEMPPDVLARNPLASMEKYQLPDGFFYLPNQFWPHKNHELVVNALRILMASGKSIVVAASGDTQNKRNSDVVRRLELKIKKFHLEKNFIFLGSIPYEDVVDLMRSTRALINPSLFEGWSTTVEEAKALGVNMILSNLAVHKEQVSKSAVFIDKNLPESLAAALAIDLSPERVVKEENSMMEARLRRRIFAKEFASMVQLCVEAYGKDSNCSERNPKQ